MAAVGRKHVVAASSPEAATFTCACMHACVCLPRHAPLRSARLWNAACAQPLLDFTHLERNQPRAAGPGAPQASGPAAAAAAAANPLLPHEVRAARFLYLDQFIGVACGSRLLLYRCVPLAYVAAWRFPPCLPSPRAWMQPSARCVRACGGVQRLPARMPEAQMDEAETAQSAVHTACMAHRLAGTS